MSALQLLDPNFHQLQVEDRRILFHTLTTGLFEMDSLTAAVVDFLTEQGTVPAEDVKRRFAGIYEPNALDKTLAELRNLGIVGDPAQPIAPPKIPSVQNFPLNTLVLNINTGCNLSCSYCYKEDLSTPAQGQKMTFETAVNSVELLSREAQGQQRINIVFFGGEPLTHWPLIQQVVAYAEQCCREKAIAVDFSLTTNATLLTEAIAEYLNAHRIGISISMDGPKALHDRTRLTVGGKGTYDVVAKKVHMLLARYNARPVGARVTLTAGNTDVVTIHHHLREAFGFHEVGFAPATASDNAVFNLSEAQLQEVFEGLKTLGHQYLEAALRNENIGFSNLHQLMTDLWKGTRKSLPCGAGIGMLAVDKVGDLHLCHRFTGSELPTFGNVHTDIARERLGGFLETALDRSGYGCATCRIRSLCAGGCYHESYVRYADPFEPVYHYCELMRDWVDFGITVYTRLQADNPVFFERHIAPRRTH